MSKAKGLGRGFDALLPTDIGDINAPVALASGDNVHQLAVNQITPNPHQPRAHFDEVQLAGLAESIKHHGVLQPLVVSDLGGGKYELIAGERRLRASKLAGLKEVPAIVRSFDEQQKLELALIENLQRAELNPIETALAYRKLVDEFNLKLDDVCKRVGQAKSTISNTMRLLNLPTEIQRMIIAGQLTEGHARSLLAIEDAQQQLEAAELVIKNGWTARQVEEFVRAHKVEASKSTQKAAAKVGNTNEFTKGLADYLHAKVTVQSTAKGGKLIIEYAGDEELKRIYDAIKAD